MALIKKCGSSKAKKIINFREENGDFSELSDVLKVLGMGEKTLIDICQTFQEQIAGGPVIKDNSELDDAEGQTRKRTTSHIHPRLSPELREVHICVDKDFEYILYLAICEHISISLIYVITAVGIADRYVP